MRVGQPASLPVLILLNVSQPSSLCPHGRSSSGLNLPGLQSLPSSSSPGPCHTQSWPCLCFPLEPSVAPQCPPGKLSLPWKPRLAWPVGSPHLQPSLRLHFSQYELRGAISQALPLCIHCSLYSEFPSLFIYLENPCSLSWTQPRCLTLIHPSLIY